MTHFTQELLQRLIIAQLTHTRNTIDLEGPMPHDDGLDYVVGACDLTSKLLMVLTTSNPNEPIVELAEMFNPSSDEFIPSTYASDGVCPEIWELIPEEDFQ